MGTIVVVVGSISKTPVIVDVAAAIAVDAFGEGVALVGLTEMTDGWFNATYLIALDDGRRCVQSRPLSDW